MSFLRGDSEGQTTFQPPRKGDHPIPGNSGANVGPNVGHQNQEDRTVVPCPFSGTMEARFASPRVVLLVLNLGGRSLCLLSLGGVM